MIATIVNALAILAGSLLGLLLHGRIKDSFKTIVYAGAGITSLIIGIQMAMSASKIVYLALSLIIGGILGTWWRIEDGHPRPRGNAEADIRARGQRQGLRLRVSQRIGALLRRGDGARRIVQGRGGRELRPDLHQVSHGRVHVDRVHRGHGNRRGTSPPLSVLVYQGVLTLAAVWLKPLVSAELLKELTGVGGALVMMIGINLLGLAKLKTANFLPALLLIVLFVVGEGFAVSHHLLGL